MAIAQRLQFDVTSPNGVLLFREASKTITSFGEHILTLTDIPSDKIYPLKYPLILLFHIGSSAICTCYNHLTGTKVYSCSPGPRK